MSDGCEHPSRTICGDFLFCQECNRKFLLMPLKSLADPGETKNPDEIWEGLTQLKQTLDGMSVQGGGYARFSEHLKKYLVRVDDRVAYVGFLKWNVRGL